MGLHVLLDLPVHNADAVLRLAFQQSGFVLGLGILRRHRRRLRGHCGRCRGHRVVAAFSGPAATADVRRIARGLRATLRIRADGVGVSIPDVKAAAGLKFRAQRPARRRDT